MDHAEVLRFDAVQVATDDLARAARAYATLLGSAPVRAGDGVVRFPLTRGAIELVDGAPGAQALRFAVVGDDPQALERARAVRFNGVPVRTDAAPPAEPAAHAPLPADAAPGFLAVDHVVVHTPDAGRALRLWRDTLGLRLALDRTFEHRGVRMLFFRSAGVTVEIVSPIGAAGTGDDLLNGIAYRVAGIAACRERLLAAGLDVSEVRKGNKAGTLVATVRSQTEGVPTLLVEAADGPRGS